MTDILSDEVREIYEQLTPNDIWISFLKNDIYLLPHIQLFVFQLQQLVSTSTGSCIIPQTLTPSAALQNFPNMETVTQLQRNSSPADRAQSFHHNVGFSDSIWSIVGFSFGCPFWLVSIFQTQKVLKQIPFGGYSRSWVERSVLISPTHWQFNLGLEFTIMAFCF